MRCPACNAENAEGATVCASCGAQMAGAAAPSAPAAPRPVRARLSKLAIFALIVGAIAPWLQALSMESGGKILGKQAAQNPLVLWGLDMGAYLLYVLGIVASLVALAQVSRRRVRGGALAFGGLFVCVGGMAGTAYAMVLNGLPEKLLTAMAGGSGHFVWQISILFIVSAIICQTVLSFVRPAAPAAAPQPAPEATAAPKP